MLSLSSSSCYSLAKPAFLSSPLHRLPSTQKCATAPRPVSNRLEKRINEETGEEEDLMEIVTRLAKKSGITARERRLMKVRESKRQRDYDKIHNYPEWAKILERGCHEDAELRAILGNTIGNPELMRKRIEERVLKKGKQFRQKETGSVLAFDVSFRDFSPISSNIWIELYGEASDRDVDVLGTAIQAWYVMGRLGAFNSSNLQLIKEPMSYNPLYDSEKAMKVMASSFHDISDLEFQDNLAKVWVDFGTADYLGLDVLLNCLTVISSEYLGIKQVVFGGTRIGDWEEGMMSAEFGYKSYEI